jgi:undecaprenyl-diphosphatase
MWGAAWLRKARYIRVHAPAEEPMHDLLNVIALGVIEGVTEFLPISSTGHLLIAEQLGLGQRSELFNIVIQAGAILAVTILYWQRVWAILRGVGQADARGSTQEPNVDVREQSKAQRVYGLKLLLAFSITAVLGLLVKKLGFELPEQIEPVAWALILGGVAMLGAERLTAQKPPNTQVTWLGASIVGVAQVLAGVFPGTSRSAATIFSAMLSGTTDREAATEFSFLVGIPTMYAASAYALLKQLKAGTGNENWSDVGIAFVVSTITAFVVVRWLIRYIRTHSFGAFALYRIVLGVVLLCWGLSGSPH